jgi:hypothetical protein
MQSSWGRWITARSWRLVNSTVAVQEHPLGLEQAGRYIVGNAVAALSMTGRGSAAAAWWDDHIGHTTQVDHLEVRTGADSNRPARVVVAALTTAASSINPCGERSYVVQTLVQEIFRYHGVDYCATHNHPGTQIPAAPGQSVQVHTGSKWAQHRMDAGQHLCQTEHRDVYTEPANS